MSDKATPERRAHCDNCGDDVGPAKDWYHGDFKSCGSQECDRAGREADAGEHDEARYRAEQDYERYR